MLSHDSLPMAVFFLTLFSSTFSGMAGGGGGFIVLPTLIALGLSPQQAVATNKLSAFGIGFGSIAAFRKRSFANPKLLIFLVALSAIISLFVPHIFKEISGRTFQLLLGVIIVALVPLVLSEKSEAGQQTVSLPKKVIGTVLMSIVLFTQGLFSGGLGSLNNVLLISFFGLSALQANATRRVITLALNTFIIITLAATTHFIVYRLALAGLAGSFIGGYIGSKIAIDKGERFAKYALATFMVVSGAWLIATA
jgi:uncharacterized membrane protein YfcA